MSSDKRLGANPLSWVDPGAAAGMTPPAPEGPSPAAPASPATPAGPGTIFTAPKTITEEDAMGKSKVKIKQTMEPAQVAAHLRDLAKSLESGTIRAESGEESIILGVADTMEFEMKVSRKKDRAKFSLEMEWADDGTRADSLKITDE